MRERNPDIEIYFNYRHSMYMTKIKAQEIETSIYIIDHLIEYHFSDAEKYIFEQHLIKRVSLKEVANNLNYSYGYTRQMLLHARDKLDKLLNEHKKNNH